MRERSLSCSRFSGTSDVSTVGANWGALVGANTGAISGGGFAGTVSDNLAFSTGANCDVSAGRGGMLPEEMLSTKSLTGKFGAIKEACLHLCLHSVSFTQNSAVLEVPGASQVLIRACVGIGGSNLAGDHLCFCSALCRHICSLFLNLLEEGMSPVPEGGVPGDKATAVSRSLTSQSKPSWN
ncbi:hypothetical protein UY3_09514 [Chelonia mydas]|uniref:Uncharacterized protein n=1 Tax=Chelonia mydas TaxID=8469 RepID=M7BCR9_CHEMY|nr:hypothetical protein UY3_09514 [Chelonia mydas]